MATMLERAPRCISFVVTIFTRLIKEGGGTLDKTDKEERTGMHPNIHAARRRLNLDEAGRINTTKNSSDEN